MSNFELNILPFEPVIQRLGLDDMKAVVEYSASTFRLQSETVQEGGDFMFSYYRLHETDSAPELLRQFLRIYPSGMLIVPSPLLEVMDDVQTTLNSRTKGFILSRYFIWCNTERGEVCFLPKYGTVIDNCTINNELKQQLVTALVKEPITINTYCLWGPGIIPSVRVFQQGEDFDLVSNPQSYLAILNDAFVQHVKHSNTWLKNLPTRLNPIDESV